MRRLGALCGDGNFQNLRTEILDTNLKVEGVCARPGQNSRTQVELILVTDGDADSSIATMLSNSPNVIKREIWLGDSRYECRCRLDCRDLQAGYLAAKRAGRLVMVASTSVRANAKILRIIRLRVTDKPGFLGKIATLLGELDANIGEITIVAQGHDFIIREFSVALDDDTHLSCILEGLKVLEGVQVEAVIDPVQHAHEGGKIESAQPCQIGQCG